MTRLGLPSSICIASLLACGAQVPPAVESPERSPDLVVATAAITLAPSGGDDTAALQAALDRATASGQPTAIALAAGTFVAAPLHAKNFHGTIRGAGMGRTILTNPQTPVRVTDFTLLEPSATNIWPVMITFVGGEFTVSDLTVRIHGAAPTTGWNIFGQTVFSYASGIDIEGNGGRADATFERVAVIGERGAGDPFGIGSNVFNGINFQGFVGFPGGPPPTSGAFTVLHSELRDVGSGTPTFNLRDARVRIEGNTFDTTFDATEIGDSTALDFLFAANRVTAGFSAMTPTNLCLGAPAGCGLFGSSVLFAANRVDAPIGFDFEVQPFGDVRCAFFANDVTYQTAAVVLGSATHGCLVVGSGAVQDQGTGNRVIQLP